MISEWWIKPPGANLEVEIEDDEFQAGEVREFVDWGSWNPIAIHDTQGKGYDDCLHEVGGMLMGCWCYMPPRISYFDISGSLWPVCYYGMFTF
jgi:hypothetical protein